MGPKLLLKRIIFRQVTDVATTREYLPKSTFLIMVDILALIPFLKMFSSDSCPPVQLWPNCLGLMESLVLVIFVFISILVLPANFV